MITKPSGRRAAAPTSTIKRGFNFSCDILPQQCSRQSPFWKESTLRHFLCPTLSTKEHFLHKGILQMGNELICREIERLSQTELSWLAKRAYRYAGMNWEDLLQEAMKSTLSGQRPWRRRVTFPRHLEGAMRSIASNMRKKEARFVHLMHDRALADARVGFDRRLEARELVEIIRGLFDDRPSLLEILDCWADGKKGPEIESTLEISKKEYQSRVKAIRRRLQRNRLSKDEAKGFGLPTRCSEKRRSGK